MNHLNELDSLKNRYFLMRHGESKANRAEVIISLPDTGKREEFGLTTHGLLSAKLAGLAIREAGIKPLIFSSDFSRARQTAEAVREVLGHRRIRLTPGLRERFFGELEGSHTVNYHDVWAADAEDLGDSQYGVEPVRGVLVRTTLLVRNIERRYENQDILLVSHGDPLQILQAGFEGIDPAEHRSVPYLHPAEWREVKLNR